MELKFIDKFKANKTFIKKADNEIREDIDKIKYIKLLNKMFGKSDIYFFMVIFYAQPKNDTVEQNILRDIKDKLENILHDNYCVMFGSLPCEQSEAINRL